MDESLTGMSAIREIRRQAILDFLIWLERERGIVACSRGLAVGDERRLERVAVGERQVREFLDSERGP